MRIFTEPKAQRQKLERQFSIGGRKHGNESYGPTGSLCRLDIPISAHGHSDALPPTAGGTFVLLYIRE